MSSDTKSLHLIDIEKARIRSCISDRSFLWWK